MADRATDPFARGIGGPAAAERLRESEARHSLLIESWAQAVWETDADGAVVADSPSWRAYTGQTPQEWLGYGWLDAIHPDDRAYAERQWRDAVAARGLVDAEFRLRAPGGGWRWTNVRAAPVPDAEGRVRKWVGMNIDIDARKRAETALRDSEARYRTLFEAMDEAYAVVEVLRDESGGWSDFRFLEVNPAFLQHTSMPDPVGRTARELLGSPNPRWAQMYGAVLDTGRPMRVQEVEPALGRVFDLNIFGLDRERNRVAVLFTDITARRRAEVALRESEERFRALVNATSYAVYSVGPDWTEMRGLDGKGFLSSLAGPSRSWPDAYVASEDQPGVWAAISDAIRNKSVFDLEHRVRRADGSFGWTHSRAVPLFDEAGGIRAWFGAATDVTERRNADAVREKAAERGAFLLRLSDALRAEPDTDAVVDRALRMLQEQLGLDRCYVVSYSVEEDRADVTHQFGNDRVSPLPDRLVLSHYPDAFRTVLDRTFVVEDEFERRGLADAERAASGKLAMRAMVASTIRRGKAAPLWSMAAVSADPRRWTSGEVALIEEVAERTWAAMDRARAEAALRVREEHNAFLVRFSDAVRGLFDPRAVAETACRLVAEGLGTERAYWAEVDWASREYVIGAAFHRTGVPTIDGRFPLDAWEPFTSFHLAGEPVVVGDTRTDLRIPPTMREGYARIAVGADLAVPVLANGRLCCTLAVNGPRPREWTAEEVALVQGIAGRCWAEVERARAEAALRERQLLFLAFAENSADTIWIANADRTRLEYLSPAFEGMFGAPRGPILDDVRRWRDLVHPDDHAVAADFVRRATAGETVVVHYRALRPSDGRLVHLRDTCFPIPDGNGRIGRIAGIVQDITDNALAGERLEAEKERFRTLTEGIPQLVWRSRDRGDWTWSSPQWQAYTGQSQRESQGRGWLAVLHPEDHDATLGRWEAAAARGRLDVEHRVRRAADGTWRWHQTRSLPVRGAAKPGQAEGPILEWLGTTTDIEDLKRLQAEQSVLLAELQHRTRNLVTVIRSIAKRSFDPSPERDTYDERLAAIGRVQGFLARAGGWSVLLEELVWTELTAAGDERSGRIAVEGPAVELPGDKAQIVALALHELATNAAKYGAIAQDGARLRVTWRAEGKGRAETRLVLKWHESGVTMPAGPPARQGYGSELIDRALPYQLRAETHREFTADGIRCTIALPVDAFRVRDDVP